VSGPDHFATAERYLADARAVPDDQDFVRQLVAEAQVHATLALAAATMHGRVSDRISSPESWAGVLS
jgi:hypothetical protein